MGTKFRTFALFALLSMLVGLAACGEQVVPTPTPAPDLADITLVPFTSPEWGISGVAPEGWVEIIPGEFLRGMPDADLTLLQHQFVLDITSEQLIATFVSEQGLKELTAWVKASTRKHSPTPGMHYGYQLGSTSWRWLLVKGVSVGAAQWSFWAGHR